MASRTPHRVALPRVMTQPSFVPLHAPKKLVSMLQDRAMQPQWRVVGAAALCPMTDWRFDEQPGISKHNYNLLKACCELGWADGVNAETVATAFNLLARLGHQGQLQLIPVAQAEHSNHPPAWAIVPWQHSAQVALEYPEMWQQPLRDEELHPELGRLVVTDAAADNVMLLFRDEKMAEALGRLLHARNTFYHDLPRPQWEQWQRERLGRMTAKAG